MKMIVALIAGLLIPGSVCCFWRFFELKWWQGLILGIIACLSLAEFLDEWIKPTISQTFGLFFLSILASPLIIGFGFQGGIPAIPAAFLSVILVPLLFYSLRNITR